MSCLVPLRSAEDDTVSLRDVWRCCALLVAIGAAALAFS
jgi:hypothetical protein